MSIENHFRPKKPHKHSKQSIRWIFMIIYLLNIITTINGEDCFGGIQTFEKLAMTDFDDQFNPAGTLLQHPDQALTRDCINLCRQQSTCQSFGLDYNRFRCAAYSLNSAGHRNNLVATNTTNFFEKVCYLGVHRDDYQKVCGVERLWAFERVKGAFLEGFGESTLTNIGSKDECAKSCLMESSFTCRSADYDYDKRICILSKEDRRTQPQAFRQIFASSRDYLENQCAAPGPTTCLYDGKQNTAVITMDSLVFAQNLEDCEHKCDKEFTFNCRSYSMDGKRCFLSGDDSISLANAELPVRIGSIYGEKKCVTETCTHGIFTYEKVTGQTIRSAIGSTVAMPHTTSLGITSDCRDMCDKSNLNCPAFSINYQSSRCDKLDRNSQGRSNDFVAREGESFFEKICLRGPEIMTMCADKLWAFERVIGYELTPLLYERVYHFVQSRRYCQEYCLQEKAFPCRSALYNDETTECKLSREDRRSKPANYIRNQNSKISYLENQCVRSHSTCPYEPTPGAYPTYTDIVETRNIAAREDCENQCNDNRKFICRSYAFYSSNNECLLSGDDRSSAGPSAITPRPGMTYYERRCAKVPGDNIISNNSVSIAGGHNENEQYSQSTSTTERPTLTSTVYGQQHSTESTVQSTSDGHDYQTITGDIGAGSDNNLPSTKLSGHNYTLTSIDPGTIPESTIFTFTTPTPSIITTIKTQTIRSESNSSELITDRRGLASSPNEIQTGSSSSSLKCGPNAKFTFERIPGFEPIGGHFSILYSDIKNPGIIGECSRRCELNLSCKAFVMDYAHHTCFAMNDNSSIGSLQLRLSSNMDYFEGFCLSSHLACSKLWSFDRIVDQTAFGVQPKAIIRYLHKSDCRLRCAEEKRFACLSASFDSTINECRLFDQDRNSGSIRLFFSKGTDYMENQCNIDLSACRYAPIERNMLIVSITKSIKGSSTFFCEIECNKATDFNCKSYAYIDQSPIPGGNLCLLSSDNRATVLSAAIRHHPRALFAEKECKLQRKARISSTPETATNSHGLEQKTELTSLLTPQIVPTTIATINRAKHCNTFDFTYDKTYGYDLRFARRERLRLPSQLAISTHCQDECTRRGARCRAFSIEYGGQSSTCYLLEDSAGENRASLSKIMGIAYFEKICLKEKSCGKLWSFERLIGFDFHETAAKEVLQVDLRADCEDFCLQEKQFICKSATYNYLLKTCKLFTQNQRSKPFSLKATNAEIDYLENQCLNEPSSCQYKDFTDAFFPFVDRISYTFSLAECQRVCDTEKLFNCRSLNYDPFTRECSLSSSDTIALGLIHLQARRNSIYSEKGSCEQVTVQCNQRDMMLMINFDSPFIGRVYAKGNPGQCYELGTGQAHLKFSIPLGSRCGTRQEGAKNFVNEIVIQQHAVIMTDNDRTIKVMCSFSAIDQTVTLSSRNQGKKGIDVTSIEAVKTRLENPISSFVTNTAAPPTVFMRILDKNDNDATLVALGDELIMKIEMLDPTSAFAISARNLYAKSSSGESLFLIDSRGCPVDSSIFPALKVDPKDGKSLRATFKAFRFPLTGVVNFEVQIKFCPEKCSPIKCVNDFDYARRKRASLGDKNHSMDDHVDKNVDILKASESRYGNGSETFLEIMEDELNGTIDEFITADIQDFNYKLSVQSTTSAPSLPAPLELISIQNTTLNRSSNNNNNNNYNNNADYRYTERSGRSDPWSNSPVNPYYDPYYNYGHNYYHGQSSNTHPISSPGSSYNHPLSASSYDPSWASSHPYPSINSYGHANSQNYPNSYAYPHKNNQRNTSGSSFYASSSFSSLNNNAHGWLNTGGIGSGGVNNGVPGQPISSEFPRESQASPSTASINIQPLTKPLASHDNGLGITTSRPKTVTERKKFRPPRPLPRPKGMPVNDNLMSYQSISGSTEVPLSLAIVVGEKDKHLDDDKRKWNIETIPKVTDNPVAAEAISVACNTGPAILLTAIIITIVHCIVAACGYLYYKKYVYYMGGTKFFTLSGRSISSENIASTVARNPRVINSNVFFATPPTTTGTNTDRSLQSSSSIGNVGFRSLYSGTLGSPP